MGHEADLHRLAAIVASSDDAIISKDLNGIVTSWNQAAERLLGYKADEIIGKSIRLIIPADRQPEEDLVMSRIRSGLPIEHFETIRQRKDGSLVPISLSPLATAESGRRYTEDDLQFAQDVAARAVLGIENAEAYQLLDTANRLEANSWRRCRTSSARRSTPCSATPEC